MSVRAKYSTTDDKSTDVNDNFTRRHTAKPVAVVLSHFPSQIEYESAFDLHNVSEKNSLTPRSTLTRPQATHVLRMFLPDKVETRTIIILYNIRRSFVTLGVFCETDYLL